MTPATAALSRSLMAARGRGEVAMRPEAARAVGSYVSREYGEDGYALLPLAAAGSGSIVLFEALCLTDGARFYLIADRYGQVDRVCFDCKPAATCHDCAQLERLGLDVPLRPFVEQS